MTNEELGMPKELQMPNAEMPLALAIWSLGIWHSFVISSFRISHSAARLGFGHGEGRE
jgi:hypothetical protein